VAVTVTQAGHTRSARARLDVRALARRGRGLALIWFIYLLATLALTWPLCTEIGNVIPGKDTDGWQNVWTMWWLKKSLLDLHTSPFYTTYLYHPYGVSLYFHTLDLGAAPISVPLQLFLSPAAAMVVTLLLVTALAGFTAYLLINHLVHNRLAAFAGGVIFAFNPYQFYHLDHGQPNLSTTFWIPLYILFLYRASREGGWWQPLVAGAMLTLVSLADWQFGFYCLLFTAFFALWELWRARRPHALMRVLRAYLVTGLVYAVLVAPIVVGMLHDLLPTNYAVRPYRQVVLHSMDLLTLLLPNPLHPLWGDLAKPLYEHAYNHAIYANVATLSYVAAALAFVALVARRRAAGFWLLMFALFVALSLGPELRWNGATIGQEGTPGPLPYRLYGALPFVDVSRSPGLFMKMGFLMLGIGAAFGLDAVMRHPRVRRWPRGMLITGLLAVALIGAEYCSLPFDAPPIDPTPAFYRQLAATPPNGWGVFDVPSPKQDFPMYDATIHSWPIVGGNPSRDNPHPLYDSSPPIAALDNSPSPLADHDIFAPSDLKTIGEASLTADRVRYVIVHKTHIEDKDRAQVNDALAQIFGDRTPIFEDGQIAVYEVQPPQLLTPVRFGPGWYDVQTLPDSGRPYRWIGDKATLHVYAPVATSATLNFTAHNFAMSYTLQVYVNGALAGTYQIPGGFNTMRVPVQLLGNDNVIDFAVTTPPHSAAELGLGTDQRKVSVGISQLSVEPAGR
jgi:hypothetical protein